MPKSSGLSNWRVNRHLSKISFFHKNFVTETYEWAVPRKKFEVFLDNLSVEEYNGEQDFSTTVSSFERSMGKK